MRCHCDKPNVSNEHIHWKILREDLVHHGFQYHEGLNIDTVPFNPTGTCKPGGLYYADDIIPFLEYGTKIARVTIPEGARVYHDCDKSKADRIVISDIIDLKDWHMWENMDVCLRAVAHGLNSPFIAGWSMWKDPEKCRVAIEWNTSLLRYVDVQTPDMCMLAVRRNGMALRHVKRNCVGDRYVDICLTAVQEIGHALEFVEDTDKYMEICYEAIKRDPGVLKLVNMAFVNDSRTERYVELCGLYQ